MISAKNFQIMRPLKPAGAQPETIGVGTTAGVSWVFDSGPRGTQLRYTRPGESDVVITGPLYLTDIQHAVQWVREHLAMTPTQGELQP